MLYYTGNPDDVVTYSTWNYLKQQWETFTAAGFILLTQYMKGANA